MEIKSEVKSVFAGILAYSSYSLNFSHVYAQPIEMNKKVFLLFFF